MPVENAGAMLIERIWRVLQKAGGLKVRACGIQRPVRRITQKLYARPVEFPPPVCHANAGGFSNDGREKFCVVSAIFRRHLALRSGEGKVNRNSCQFKIRAKSLKTLQ